MLVSLAQGAIDCIRYRTSDTIKHKIFDDHCNLTLIFSTVEYELSQIEGFTELSLLSVPVA